MHREDGQPFVGVGGTLKQARIIAGVAGVSGKTTTRTVVAVVRSRWRRRPLAVSEPVSIGKFGPVDFPFVGDNRIELKAGRKYWIWVEEC